jgi:hypothetical protein
MELRVLRGIAKIRSHSFRNKANCGSSKLMCGEGSPEEKSFRGNLCGVFGEYWFARTHGGFFDHVPKELGDGHKPDVYVGLTGYAVKTVMYDGPTPMIMIQDFKQIEQCDRIALCATNGTDKVSFVGTRSRLWFMQHHVVKDFGNGPTMCLTVKTTGE